MKILSSEPISESVRSKKKILQSESNSELIRSQMKIFRGCEPIHCITRKIRKQIITIFLLFCDPYEKLEKKRKKSKKISVYIQLIFFHLMQSSN